MFGQCTGAATTVKALLSVVEAVSTKVCHQSKQKVCLTPSGNCNLLSVSDTSGNTDKNFSHRKHHWDTPKIANFVKAFACNFCQQINKILPFHLTFRIFFFFSWSYFARQINYQFFFQLFQNSMAYYFSIPPRMKHHYLGYKWSSIVLSDVREESSSLHIKNLNFKYCISMIWIYNFTCLIFPQFSSSNLSNSIF